jgi:hypothetical protein
VNPVLLSQVAAGLLHHLDNAADVGNGLALGDQLLGGMQAEEARRLTQLEKENARLKKLLTEAELEKAMLKDLAEGNF